VTRYLKSRKEHLIVTSVGRSLHSYGLKRLELLAVSDLTEDEITCLVSEGNTLYTACGNIIHSWKRATKIDQTYIGHEKPVYILFPFGPHLISIDEGNLLKVWDRRSEEVFLELVFDENTFKISAINHPSTYLNKILLGSEQGRMQLWNLKTSKLIYTFDGWNAGITVLEQAPAVDVTAVGLSDGRIILHNLKFDETIVEFVQDWGRVTSITFRTDGPAVMATGSPAGHVVLWNLEERKVASQILEAHDKTVASLKCFPCEPLMVSSSPDNSIKVWIFDQADLGGRLLKLREGHAEQPTCVRFHGANGYTILSSGTDSSLRVFNATNESGNRSMGKATYNRKTSKKKKEYSEVLRMPPIVDFTTETTREKEWDNIAALHLGIPVVTTWSFEKKRMGDLKLLPERLSNETRATLNVVASSICLTNCGNFVVVGYSSGHTDRFNIQSGIHRCGYGQPSAHKGSVRGVIVDPLNQLVITGCGQGLVKFWSFKPKMYSSVCKYSH
jgi:U3 small nucleolar RNA-associated protein 21